MSAQSLDYNPSAVVFSPCLSDPSIVASLGDLAHYLYSVTPWAPSDKLLDEYTGWTASEFSDKYRTIYNVDPPYHAASSFAAATALVVSMEIAQSLLTLDIVEVLSRNRFETFYANFTLDINRQASFDMLITQVR